MTRTYLIRLRNFILLALIQVLIFSNIHLFGYATAYLYLIFLLKLPCHTSRNELLLWGFAFGLIVDIFGNTPGLNAASATLVAFFRNPILSIFIQKETIDDFIPGIKTLNWSGYICYSLIFILLFYTTLFLLEIFTITSVTTLLISVASSSIFTMSFVLTTECFTRK